MEALSKEYKNHLEQLKLALVNSELLTTYLESEEPADYKALYEAFEPHILELYELVADKNPMQIVALEKALLDESFEGVFLPKILGFSVLRPESDNKYKYKRPQERFKEILLTICNSANFESIKQRIGQTVQIGFALSSSIWLTNLFNSITNKKVKTFLQSMMNDKLRDVEFRKTAFKSYEVQFKSFNFKTADFPETVTDLNVDASSLLEFLIYRSDRKFDNTSLTPHLIKLISNKEFAKEDVFIDLMMIIGLFYPLQAEHQKEYSKTFDSLRSSVPDFSVKYFNKLILLYQNNVQISPETEKRISNLVNKSVKDELAKYYTLMDVIHTKGFIHEDSIEAARQYYDQHKGLSSENECLRDSIFGYFNTFLSNLDEDSYHEYFEINKVMVSYINTFSNQRFNQNIKELSMKYIQKLLHHFADKRSKDYQDIKKFVTTTFLDLSFKSEKELAEIFKTKK
ncbi:MAG: hypothetical protein IPK25_17700 [Saprospiraceae bacterium]|nr:hypothetical protein [Saprospiraceae bacterium]